MSHSPRQIRARVKGQTIEALEKVSQASSNALDLLRSPDAKVMTPRLSAQLHEVHAGLGRVLSLLQFERGFSKGLEMSKKDAEDGS